MFYSSAALLTLKRKSSDGCPTPSKKYSFRCSMCLIFPDTESQQIFVSRSKKEQTLQVSDEVDTVDVISYDGLQVLVASAIQSSLQTALGQYLHYDAAVVVFSQALMTGVPNAHPGTCYPLNYSESNLKPNFQTDTSILASGKFYTLSSSLTKNKTTTIGLVRCELGPHHLQHYIQNEWSLQCVAVSIGNIAPDRINSDIIATTFKGSIGTLVTGAYEVLRRLIESGGNVRNAIHLASTTIVPDILTPPDDASNLEPHTESPQQEQKLIFDFLHLIKPVITFQEEDEFAQLLFNGDEGKYYDSLLAEPTDMSDTISFRGFTFSTKYTNFFSLSKCSAKWKTRNLQKCLTTSCSHSKSIVANNLAYQNCVSMNSLPHPPNHMDFYNLC